MLDNRQFWARLAGAGYLVIIVAGIFAEVAVRQQLIVLGDPAATMANVRTGEALFRAGIAADLLMLVADVLVAVAIYAVFREAHRTLAVMSVCFRVAHAATYAAMLLTLHLPILLRDVAGAEDVAFAFLEAHGIGYATALVFFGAYCLVLARLVLISRYVPPVLGWLLAFAGAGYLIDGFAQTLLTDYASVEQVLTLVVFVPAVIGELSFALWLLIKGVRVPA